MDLKQSSSLLRVASTALPAVEDRFPTSMRPFRLAIRLLCLALALYSALGFLARPIADDFCELADTAQYGAFGLAPHYYMTWSGRYALFIIKGITFGTFGVTWTALAPFVLALCLVAAWTYALRPLTPLALFVALACTYGLISGMPLYQGYYFQSASLMYLAPIALSGLLVSTLTRRWPLWSVAVIGFVVAGFNESHALAVLGVLSLIILRRREWRFIVAWCAVAIGVGITLLAPGNMVRGEQYLNHPTITDTVVSSLGVSASVTVSTMVSQPMSLALPFAVGLLAFSPQSRRRRLKSAVVVVGSLLFAAGSLMPVYYAVNGFTLRSFTLFQGILVGAAFLLGVINARPHQVGSASVAVLAGIAVLLTIGVVIPQVPNWLVAATITDRGFEVPMYADLADMPRANMPWIAECRGRYLNLTQ